MTHPISRRHFLAESLAACLTAVMPWPKMHGTWLSPTWETSWSYQGDTILVKRSILCGTPSALKKIVRALGIGEEHTIEAEPYWTVPRYLLSGDRIWEAQKLGAKMCKDEVEFDEILSRLKKEYYS